MKVIKAKNESDRILLEGLWAADNTRIRRIYDLALPEVIRWVKANRGSEQDARDVFQEALIALFKKNQAADSFVLSCTLKSFLRIMCRNLWLTRIRDLKKWEMVKTEDIEIAGQTESLLQAVEYTVQDRLYYRHFDRLDEKCRNILQWFFDSVPLAEIAGRLGTSETYIKKRKFTCKEKLISEIQADPEFRSL